MSYVFWMRSCSTNTNEFCEVYFVNVGEVYVTFCVKNVPMLDLGTVETVHATGLKL